MSTRLRRSARRHSIKAEEEEQKEQTTQDPPHSTGTTNDTTSEVDTDNDEQEPSETFEFDGVEYDTYQEMVNAKRKRNQRVLEQSGLLDLTSQKKRAKVTPGLVRSKAKPQGPPPPRRQSSRLRGVASDGKYVDEERAGRFVIRSGNGTATASNAAATTTPDKQQEPPQFFRNRLNNGSPISVQQAVDFIGPKWLHDHSQQQAERLVKELATAVPSSNFGSSSKTSPTSVQTCTLQARATTTTTHLEDEAALLAKAIDDLSVDDLELNVAKVTPDRIYSLAVHSSTDTLLVCAGDKQGHLGIWKVHDDDDDATSTHSETNNDGVHLFRPHARPICSLEWGHTDTNSLYSFSYDGTVRRLLPERQSFDQVFCCDPFQTGHGFWTQFGCLDGQDNVFLTTSVGTAMHVDVRMKEKLTFHEELSEKKINTLSLHPNGHSLITSGLDGKVNLWDIRKFAACRLRSSRQKAPSPIAHYNCGRSVNSAFFSPSGQHIVTTTMAHKLDLFQDFHLATSSKQANPTTSIHHDNMTGRWLTTLQAVFHPKMDGLFAVGSMKKPRCIEFYDTDRAECRRAVAGEALTAVASRLAFHPRTDEIVLVGGNSSGRVTILR